MRFRYLMLTVVLLGGLAAAGRADILILKSGARVQGEVSVSNGMVRISNHNGTSHIRGSRIARVIRSPGRSPGANPPRRNPRRSVRRNVRRPSYRSVSSETVRELRRKISVDFQDTPPSAVIEYLSEITEANFSYNPATLDSYPPVTMKLDDVSVGRVLNLLVEGTELSWGLKDNIVRIREGRVAAVHARVYDVRDLLLNVEDKRAPRVRTVRDTGSDDDDDDDGFSSAAGWGGDDDDGYGFDSEDRDDERGRTASESLPERARALAGLITSTVHPNSWADPAVIVIGGVRRDESEEALW